MFHQGNLQSGISLAIQEQKLVGILVRDDGAESATWENEWLQSGWIANLLEQTAVLLRLEAGSTEAGFLSAFCTISSTPTFVVIQNGQLKEQLSAGVTEDEFINRVREVLGASPIPGSARSSSANRQATTESQESPSIPPTTSPSPNVATPQAPAPVPAPAPVSAPIPVPTQTPTPPPTSKDKGKQKAVPTQPNPQASAAQQAARDALRKKKREEKEELERIKARIEADKAERKAQAEARKAERERERQQQSSSSSEQQQQSTPQFRSPSTKGSQAAQVHLNVRLFDGRTVRATFPRTAKLETDVRPWVDREAAAAASTSETPHQKQPPYYFKQILAPLPSRELSVSDEAETLGDIDLAPSATLVLIPVKGYTEAYSGGGSGGIVYGAAGNVMGLVGGVFNVAGSVLGYVGNTVSSVLGGGGGETAATANSTGQSLGSSAAASRESGGGDGGGGGSGATPNVNIRVRTLADQRARDQQQPNNFYNGNQLSYAPRDDESRNE
ncbi:hypothetical protein DM02DRAFT_677242 [Periconia macrospinosa]|uniref:UBX domain-containing protein 2 n=1 Tax=Periconia macrospinosa TaxID=97972 RepID=A0A2V1D6H5_9PLEO|nr:hypothetical protein DM02DRAFT_677242 [Periconia macrospinosa]